MSKFAFPEIQAATEALESRIKITEAEVAEMKEAIKTKRTFLKAWQKAVIAISAGSNTPKKKL